MFGAVLHSPGVEMKEVSSKKQMGVGIKDWVPVFGFLSHLRQMLLFYTCWSDAMQEAGPCLK